MEFLEYLLPDQDQLSLESYELNPADRQLTLHVSSTQVIANCPVCHSPTHRVHSHYQRTLKDLPCVDFCLTIFLSVCKFFCTNKACERRIFTERLPKVTAPWARKTVRLAKHFSDIGIALGGAAAAHLCNQIGYEGSRNTLLRSIFKVPLPSSPTPKILGVDDFAFRRGETYGTILVDLERHQPIDLLADREAKTLEDWLKEHPGIEIISRDRSKSYRLGARNGAPNALQVADRFHLLQNLEEVLEDVFSEHTKALKEVELTLIKAKIGDSEALEVASKAKSSVPPKPRHSQSRERRLAQYEQVHSLREQGYQIADIAHHVGIHQRTVYRFLAASTFPEYKSYRRQTTTRSSLDPYKPYLLQQWNQGHHQTKQLCHEIQLQGYQGSYSTVIRYTRQLRQLIPTRPPRESLNDLPGRGPVPISGVEVPKNLTVKRAAWLVMRKINKLTKEEEETLEQLGEHAQFSEAVTFAQSFLFIVRKRLPQHLDTWLERAKNSALKPFQRFAKGLRDDYDAVKAGMTLEVSNGPVEGQNNRLKMIKRQMFGRAGLELLTKRLILGS